MSLVSRFGVRSLSSTSSSASSSSASLFCMMTSSLLMHQHRSFCLSRRGGGFVVPMVTAGNSHHHHSSCSIMSPTLSQSRRFVSHATVEATKDLPRTPGGQNAFKVLEYDLSNESTMDSLRKHFKTMAVKCHPDRPGGSNEQMSELNAAFKIAKENFNLALDKLGETKRARNASAEYHKMQRQRSTKEEDLARTGGIHGARRVNVAREKQNKFRNAKELQAAWETLKVDTTDAVNRMILRYEVAMEQTLHFKKLSILHEISVRERWLRKMYVKNVWEEIHEMRQELLRKGARSQQQSQLAEEMVAFATATERKLTEDFHRQAQVMVQGQLRIVAGRATYLFFWAFVTIFGIKMLCAAIFGATFSVRYKKAFFGHD